MTETADILLFSIGYFVLIGLALGGLVLFTDRPIGAAFFMRARQVAGAGLMTLAAFGFVLAVVLA